MPRKARIDTPGALHHVIIRGIECKKIFRSDYDRRNFLSRISELISETKELVRCIHLNRLRTGLAGDLDGLDKHPWCGHSILMNKEKQPWQDVDYVY